MLKDIKLPELLLGFIESAKQQFLVDADTKHVEYNIELAWIDMVYPSYATITFHISGSGSPEWIDRCIKLQRKLNYTKPDALFDCMPMPHVRVECY